MGHSGRLLTGSLVSTYVLSAKLIYDDHGKRRVPILLRLSTNQLRADMRVSIVSFVTLLVDISRDSKEHHPVDQKQKGRIDMPRNSSHSFRWSTLTGAGACLAFIAVAMTPDSFSIKSTTTVTRPGSGPAPIVIHRLISSATTLIITKADEAHRLLKALVTTGHHGYVYGDELYGRNPDQSSFVGVTTLVNPRGVIVQSAYTKAPGGLWPEAHMIPVYAANGTTVIGHFTIAR